MTDVERKIGGLCAAVANSAGRLQKAVEASGLSKTQKERLTIELTKAKRLLSDDLHSQFASAKKRRNDLQRRESGATISIHRTTVKRMP